MSYVLNQVTAPDQYGSGAAIEDVPIDSITIDVVNQAIYWQLKLKASGVGGYWEGAESYMLPGSRIVSSDTSGEIVGIRFRAATPANSVPSGSFQAVVSIRTQP